MLSLLKILEDLITLQMNVKCDDIPVNDNILEEWLIIAQIESDKIKREFKSRILTIKGENQVKQFVNNNYARLVCLSNKLFHAIKKCEEAKGKKNQKILCVKKVVLILIEGLLCYIRKVSPKHCSTNQKLTEFCRCLLEKRVDSVVNSMEHFKHEELVDVAIVQVSTTIKKHNAKITFKEGCYIYRLIRTIHKASTEDKQNLFTQHLICLNFNSVDFLNFLIARINQQISGIDIVKGKVEKLYWYLKKINQVRIKPGIIFNPKQKGVKEYITDWIVEEITFLEKKLSLSGKFIQGMELPASDFKVNTGLSVAQIACFVKLLTDVEVIQNMNKKELIKFIALYVKSKKQENISPNSLWSKFYNIEDSTRMEIKNLLIQLLNQANKR